MERSVAMMLMAGRTEKVTPKEKAIFILNDCIYLKV
jgi:hypothetical protein